MSDRCSRSAAIHRLDQTKRIVFHQQAVAECAGISFVGIGNHVFARRSQCCDSGPFAAGGKARGAAPAQTRYSDRLADEIVLGMGGAPRWRTCSASVARS